MITLPPNFLRMVALSADLCPMLTRTLDLDGPHLLVSERDHGDETPHHLIIGGSSAIKRWQNVFWDSVFLFRHRFKDDHLNFDEASYIFGFYNGNPTEDTYMDWGYMRDVYFVGIDL